MGAQQTVREPQPLARPIDIILGLPENAPDEMVEDLLHQLVSAERKRSGEPEN